MVTVEHLRIARARHGGYCTKGMGRWFARHGLDLRHFLKNGYPVETIAALNDAFGNKVVAIALEDMS
jgi:hypothetical protein